MTLLCGVCQEPIVPNVEHEHWAIAMDRLIEGEIEARQDAYYEALAEQAEERS